MVCKVRFLDLWEKNRQLQQQIALVRQHEQRQAAIQEKVDAALAALRGEGGVRDVGRAIALLEQLREE